MSVVNDNDNGARPLLSVRDLRIGFGDKEVVHGVSFDIRPGEKLALVGESGSGKTITALSLLRLVPQAWTKGGAVLDLAPEGPRDLLTLPERALRGIRGKDVAVIFQEPMTALNPLFSIGDQIAEVIELHQALPRAKAWQRAVALLASTGIPEPERRAQSFPHQLSGGQRQRAMIAMALACEPKLLLADEPTTALDVTLRQQILDLLADLQRRHGMAVLMITHDLNLVRRFADRVAVMEHGVLVEQGAVQDVFANPQHAYTRKLLDSRPERSVADPSPQAQPLLEAKGLRVSYPVPKPGIRGWFKRGEFVAVKGADWRLEAGQTLGVIGESGSGKSTLALAARMGLGAVLGSGSQPVPWVHLDDVVGLIRHAIAEPMLQGALNAVAPHTARQAGFARMMAASVGRRAWLRVPAWPLRMALGEMSELLLCGQQAVPTRALASGYRFRLPGLAQAMRALAAG